VKIALPTFGNRISPRFDCAGEFLLLTIEGSQVVETKSYESEKWSMIERIRKLAEVEVDIVICGGIDAFSIEQLKLHKIKLISWITGNVDDAVIRFIKGELEPMSMIGNNGHCCGKWRFRGGRK